MSAAPITNVYKRTGAGVFALGVALLIDGCSSNPPAPVVDLSTSTPHSGRENTRSPPGGTYHVVRGDTLYAIAFRNGVDYRELAAWNGIEPPYRIYAGQDIRLGPSSPERAATRAAGAAAPAAPTRAPTAPSTAAPSATVAQNGKPAKGSAMFEDVAAAAPTPVRDEGIAAPQAAASGPAVGAAAASPPPGSSAGEAPVKPAAESPPQKAGVEGAVNGAGGLVWRWPGKGALIGSYVAGDQTRQGIDIAGTAGDPVLAAADGEVVYSGNGLLGYGELIIVKHNASFLSAYGHNRKRLVQEGDRIRAGQQIAEMGSSASSRDELHFEIRKNGKPVNPLDYLPAR
jgi:lipoprotein NlpD